MVRIRDTSGLNLYNGGLWLGTLEGVWGWWWKDVSWHADIYNTHEAQTSPLSPPSPTAIISIYCAAYVFHR